VSVHSVPIFTNHGQILFNVWDCAGMHRCFLFKFFFFYIQDRRSLPDCAMATTFARRRRLSCSMSWHANPIRAWPSGTATCDKSAITFRSCFVAIKVELGE
jgi:hypothetical protein